MPQAECGQSDAQLSGLVLDQLAGPHAELVGGDDLVGRKLGRIIDAIRFVEVVIVHWRWSLRLIWMEAPACIGALRQTSACIGVRCDASANGKG
jgi:hypothetical protein